MFAMTISPGREGGMSENRIGRKRRWDMWKSEGWEGGRGGGEGWGW